MASALVSELVGPWQNVEGTGRGRDRDVATQEEVLLLRPECGLQRPRPAQPALCSGTQTACVQLFSCLMMDDILRVDVCVWTGP